jgi:hypothetical protein
MSQPERSGSPRDDPRQPSPSEPELSSDERSQIAARLRLSPADRLRYLMDMLAFESLARVARRIE